VTSIDDVISEIVAVLSTLAEAESDSVASRQTLDAGREMLQAAAQGTMSPLLITAVQALDEAALRLANAEEQYRIADTHLRQYLGGLGGVAAQGVQVVRVPDPRRSAEDDPKPKAPPITVQALGPLRPRPAGDHEHPVADWAVECARDICIYGWQETVANQLASAITFEAWQTFRENDAADCANLARAAQAIQDVLDLPSDFVEAQMKVYLAGSGFESGAAELLAGMCGKLLKLAKRPLDQPMLEVIRGIRVLGVAICAVQDALDSCPCLDALARNLIGDVVHDLALKELLRPGLVASSALESTAMPLR